MAQGMCTACGADVTGEDNFCPSCGASLSEVGVTPSGVPAESAQEEITAETEEAAAPVSGTGVPHEGGKGSPEAQSAFRRAVVLIAVAILLAVGALILVVLVGLEGGAG